MMTLLVALLIVVLATCIYFLMQTKNRINSLEVELKQLNQQLAELDQVLNGKAYENEIVKYGSMTGKVDYLDGRVNALIDVLNEKFIDLGRRLDVHEMQFGSSLDSEIIERHLRK